MPNERVRGFVQLFGTNVITKLAWALTLFLLLHKLGPQRFGFLATLWAIATIIAGGADLGTGQALLREGSRTPGITRHLARQSAWLQIAASLALGCCVAIGAWEVLPSDLIVGRDRALVILLSVFTPFIDRFQTLFTVFSQIGQNYSVYSWIRSMYFVCLLGAILLVLNLGAGLLAISAIYFSTTLLFSASMATRTWRLLPVADQSSPSSFRSLLGNGLPFLAIGVLALAYGRAEVSVLGGWGMLAAAGAYHIIYQLVLVAYSVSGMFFTVVYPRLYRHLSDHLALQADFRNTTQWLSLLAWFVVPPLILYARPILQIIGGAPMIAYAHYMQALSLIILLAPASAGLNFLLPLDMLRTRIMCDTFGVFLTICIAVLAAVSGRPLLAAIGAVVGYTVSVVSAQLALKKSLPGCTSALLEELASAGWRAAFAAMASWLLPLPWWTCILFFVFFYSTLLILTRHPAAGRLREWMLARAG